jgi:hypothetical protein
MFPKIATATLSLTTLQCCGDVRPQYPASILDWHYTCIGRYMSALDEHLHHISRISTQHIYPFSNPSPAFSSLFRLFSIHTISSHSLPVAVPRLTLASGLRQLRYMMGKITYSDGVAIYELVYYSPCLATSLSVVLRHGPTKESGWIFLTTFCLIRIIGAAARIATIVHPGIKTAYTIAVVTSLLGLSPLLMASLGLVSRSSVISLLPNNITTANGKQGSTRFLKSLGLQPSRL